LAWIRGGGTANLRWIAASFGRPPKNEPWITFVVIVAMLLIPMPGRDRSPLRPRHRNLIEIRQFIVKRR
jgi:hypothetical protein